jgi:hypothetical protein
MTSSTDQSVWYASYGSNLFADRFACYIQGGQPAGSTNTCRGARDKRPPIASAALEIPHRLYFSGTSTWGGSPAFIDSQRSDDHRAFVRAYLIRWQQFEDVVAQENQRELVPISIRNRAEGDIEQIGPGRYETLLCVGTRDEVPIMTFTAPWTFSEVVPGAPSLAYVSMLVAGLRQAHGLNDVAIVEYLASAPGCTGALVHEALEALEQASRQSYGESGHDTPA